MDTNFIRANPGNLSADKGMFVAVKPAPQALYQIPEIIFSQLLKKVFKKITKKICETEKLHIYLQPIGFLNKFLNK
jgi:hypothetical protein